MNRHPYRNHKGKLTSFPNCQLVIVGSFSGYDDLKPLQPHPMTLNAKTRNPTSKQGSAIMRSQPRSSKPNVAAEGCKNVEL